MSELRLMVVMSAALTLAAACRDGDSIGSRQGPLFGDIHYADDCTSDMRELLDKSVQWGRIVAVSDVYQECIDEAVRTGLRRNDWGIGPYRECTQDAFYGSSLNTQLAMARAATLSLNDVSMSCVSDSDAIAYTSQNDGYDHINPESLTWGEWFARLGPDSCWRTAPATCATNGDVSWPMMSIANATWHEAAHTHDYSHGTNEQETAPAACGYPDDDGWHFQVNTMPYIIGQCVGYVLHESGEACRLTDCGPDSLHIIDDLDETGCSCIRDPNLGGGPTADPIGADLTVTAARAVFAGSIHEVTLTIRNRGVTGALDFQVAVLGVDQDGDTIDWTGEPILLGTAAVSALNAGAERSLTVDLPNIDNLTAVEVVVDRDGTVRETDESNNTLRTGFELPNLRVTRVDARIGWRRIEGTVLVRNTSTLPTHGTNLVVGLTEDGHRSGPGVNIHVAGVAPGDVEPVPFIIDLPEPDFWGAPDSLRIGPERHGVQAEVDPFTGTPETDETDNVMAGVIVWPDLSIAEATAPSSDGFFGDHHLEVGYQVANADTAFANLFAHEVRLETRSGNVLARSRVERAELPAGESLERAAIGLDFSDLPGKQSCDGHRYNEYFVRFAADDPDQVGEMREDNNQVASRFVTTDDLAPVAAIGDPGLIHREVASPDDIVSFTVGATTSDPDGDPVTLTWSSSDVALHNGTIAPGPGPGQATVTMSARALSALRCVVPGAKTVVLIHVTATARDCILESSATRTIAVELQITDDGPIPDERICELAHRGLDELEIALLRFRFTGPLCPFAGPGGGQSCMGMSWLNVLADRWGKDNGNTLPAAALKTLSDLRAIVASIPLGVIQSWDRDLALAELDGMLAGKKLTGGAITALVLEQSVFDGAKDVFSPVPIPKGKTAEVFALGYTASLGGPALVSGELGLIPLADRPVTPAGSALLADVPVMAIVQPGQLGANATIKYTAARGGQRLRLIGFTPTGPVDITTRWNASTRTVTGHLTGTLWGVGVAR